MSDKKIKFKLITHEKVVFDGEVDEIYSKGLDGEFGILPDHTPFMSALSICVTKIINDGKPLYFSTVGGVLQFINNEAVILSEDAENGNDIDLALAKSEKEKEEAKFYTSEKIKDIQQSEKALAVAISRFKAANKEM